MYSQMILTAVVVVFLSCQAYGRKELPPFEDINDDLNMVEPKHNLWETLVKPKSKSSFKDIFRLLALYELKRKSIAIQQPIEVVSTTESLRTNIPYTSSRKRYWGGPQSLPLSLHRITQEKNHFEHSARYGWVFK